MKSIDPDLLAKLPKASSPVPLTGSPKQIKWAETIRAKLIFLAPVALVNVLNAVADSTWWIRNERREYADFNWEFLLPKTDSPTETTPTLALPDAEPKPKLDWKKVDERLHVAPLFSWSVIQVFRANLGGWRWAALNAVSTTTFTGPNEAKIAVEEFIRTQFSQVLTRL